MDKIMFCILGVAIGGLLMIVAMEMTTESYDPNDGAYKFIPEAPADWREQFGTNERTRLLHSISELRVVVARQGRLLMEMRDPNKVDPNES